MTAEHLPKRVSVAVLAVAGALLAACGEQSGETAQAPAPETAQPAPPPMLGELPVARTPDIPPPSSHIALNPGRYSAEGVDLVLSALRFELEAPERGISASGSYEVVNGRLSLSATEGDSGDVAFPIECRLTRTGPQILFEDATEGSCAFMAGVAFARDTQPGATRLD